MVQKPSESAGLEVALNQVGAQMRVFSGNGHEGQEPRTGRLRPHWNGKRDPKTSDHECKNVFYTIADIFLLPKRHNVCKKRTQNCSLESPWWPPGLARQSPTGCIRGLVRGKWSWSAIIPVSQRQDMFNAKFI